MFHLGDTPPCVEKQLPVPGNGSVVCTPNGYGLRCTLTCKDMFVSEAIQSISPQYCRDGVWDFEDQKHEIPDCQRECYFTVYYYCVHIEIQKELCYTISDIMNDRALSL